MNTSDNIPETPSSPPSQGIESLNSSQESQPPPSSPCQGIKSPHFIPQSISPSPPPQGNSPTSNDCQRIYNQNPNTSKYRLSSTDNFFLEQPQYHFLNLSQPVLNDSTIFGLDEPNIMQSEPLFRERSFSESDAYFSHFI